MKKTLYAILAVLLIGGFAYALSQTSLLKGDLGGVTLDQQTEEGPGYSENTDPGSLDQNPGGSFGNLSEGIINGGLAPFDKDDLLPDVDINEFPEIDANPDLYNPDGYATDEKDEDCIQHQTIDFSVKNTLAGPITGLTADDIQITPVNTIDPNQNLMTHMSLDRTQSGKGIYSITNTTIYQPEELVVIIDRNGYQRSSNVMKVNNLCSNTNPSTEVILDFNHTVKVIDHNGNNVSDAEVISGYAGSALYDIPCAYSTADEQYYCATDETHTSGHQYEVNKTGYVSKAGLFTSIINNQTIHQDVTLDEFAWSLIVEESDRVGAKITDAEVNITSSEGTTECIHTENGKYWCSETSFFSPGGLKPAYSVSADGYENVEGSFDEARTSNIYAPIVNLVKLDSPESNNSNETPETNEEETETVTEETPETNSEDEPSSSQDLSAYCGTLEISSEILPLDADADRNSDIPFTISVTSETPDYEDVVYLSISGNGTINGKSGYEAPISGTETNIDLVYEGGKSGDSLTVSVAGGACNTDFLYVTQLDPNVYQDPNEESDPTTLACNSVDITPDDYMIYLTADASTQHQFEVNWTVVEQLISLREAPEWIKNAFAFKNSLNPLINLASTQDPLVITIRKENGLGDLFYADDRNTPHNELVFISSEAGNNSEKFYYSGAVGGDILSASANDLNCSDTLTLQEEEETVSDIDFDVIAEIELCETYPFPDVQRGQNLSEHIFCLAQVGAVQGYAHNGHYGPQNNITRAELVKIVVAMTGEPLSSRASASSLQGISGHWAEQYIKTAERLNIVRASEGVNFEPDKAATRAELVTYLIRGAQETLWGWTEADIPFSDVSKYDPYAYAIIIAARAMGDVPGVGIEAVIQGYSDGTFKANNTLRRDEAAAIFIRGFKALYL